jgi:cytochrome c553
MRKRLTVAAVLAAFAATGLTVYAADAKSIGDVMKEAHAGGPKSLRAKVTGGKGDKEDKEKLLSLYEDLAKNKPPKGDEKAWTKKTDAIVKAAKEVVDGKKSEQKLANATNCKACHDAHKGE